MLEVIDKGRSSESHRAPLLFVHGAWHGAWCWDEHFLDFFADKGYRVLAVSLRGHSGSTSSKPLRACSIADYVDDVRSVSERLPVSPVVIGHSMGGFVVQKYLESHDAPAGVLVASAPTLGVFGVALRSMRRRPWLTTRAVLTGRSLPLVNKTLARTREAFFSAQTPQSRIDYCGSRLQEESPRALFLDMMLLTLPRPKCVTTPLLVLGAECDGFFTPKEVRATARAYRTEAEFFPDIGHDMMLEPGWPAVAERIHTWLGNRGL
jgi:pimeloyl-ACP methyl ester carboxylesterase